jgi:diguanylate cyclase (GGDEF)-like protein
MTNVESKVRGFKIGGVDYVNKPFQHAEILVRVNTHITMLRLRKDLETRNAELERLANTDYLTKLYNRRRFYRTSEKMFKEAMRTGYPISITLLDLDYFKKINDTHGHMIGDQVLIHVARLIRDHCRENDMAARYGGEEFAILHPNVDKSAAFQVVEKIRKNVEGIPFTNEENEIDVTFSAGVVDLESCKNCPRVDDMFALADKALYRAKDGGRNQIVVFEE